MAKWQPTLKVSRGVAINTLRPRQDGRLFPDGIFNSILFHENVQIKIKISLTFVLKAPINNIPALVQTRRQAIIWTNDAWFTDAYMRNSASMS